jgi:hypothetical protein
MDWGKPFPAETVRIAPESRWTPPDTWKLEPSKRFDNGVSIAHGGPQDFLLDDDGRVLGYFQRESDYPSNSPDPRWAFRLVFGCSARKSRALKAWNCRVRFKRIRGPGVQVGRCHSVIVSVGFAHLFDPPQARGYVAPSRLEQVLQDIVLA